MRGGLASLLGSVLLLATAGSEAAIPPVRVTEPAHARHLLPPPQAPVDGYHHAHRTGALLRFDSELGVYVVAGASDVYFFDDAFIRNRDGRWEFSARPAGPWSPGRPEWVPVRLRVALYREAPAP